jgi:hypothetical protein
MTETYMTTYLAHRARATQRIKVVRNAAIVLGALGFLGITITPVLFGLIPLSAALLWVAPKCTSFWQKGLEGEERLRSRLREILDDRCVIFYNVAGGDLDCVIVAPQGVWAIEAKHYVGEIFCTGSHWCRVRRRNHEVYPEAMRSPSEQLTRGIMDLKAFFLSRGIRTWIQGMVVFTHPRSSLRVTGLGNVSAVTLGALNLPDGPELPEPTRKAIIESLLSLRAGTHVRRCA